MPVINGDNGNNILNDTAGDDTVNGLDGDDTITVTAGYDTANGGIGDDTLVVDYGATGLAINSGSQFATDPNAPGAFGVGFTGFEHFVVTTGSGNDSINIASLDGNDVISTGIGDDFIATNSGDDIANGGAGNDLIDVGTGDDTADGGSGNDRISANMSAAASAIAWNLQTNSYSGPIGSFTNFEYFGTVTTGGGNDTIVTRTGNFDDGVNLEGGDDSVTVANGNDSVNGGSGLDTLIVNYRTTGLAIGGGFNDFATDPNAPGAFGVGFTQFERFVVNTGSGNDSIAIAHLGGGDVISTGGGDDYIDTNSGDDILNGGAGADEMHGGLGDDLYYVDSVGDTAIEGADAGVDHVRASIDYALGGNVEILTLGGAARVGTGNALANTLFGAGGADTLSGLTGDDILRGKNARDVLLGGDGGDLLDGGIGKDTMTGGSGQDDFQFRDGDFGGTRSVADVITDFSQADGEKLRLNLVDADTTAGGNQAFSWIGDGAFTGVAGQLHYAQAGGNTYVEGDLDGDSVADIFINLTGTIDLVAADFVL